jgi:hypothetical protein
MGEELTLIMQHQPTVLRKTMARAPLKPGEIADAGNKRLHIRVCIWMKKRFKKILFQSRVK